MEDQVAGLTRVTDKTTVKKLFEISSVTVGKIAGRVVREELDPNRLDSLAIAIDEFSYQRKHKYVTIVINHESGEAAWVGEGKSAETLERFSTSSGRIGWRKPLPPLHPLGKTLTPPTLPSCRRNHPETPPRHPQLLQLRLTNGPLEGMNNRIRLLSHRPYRFMSAQTLAAMVFLSCLSFFLPLPKIA